MFDGNQSELTKQTADNDLEKPIIRHVLPIGSGDVPPKIKSQVESFNPQLFDQDINNIGTIASHILRNQYTSEEKIKLVKIAQDDDNRLYAALFIPELYSETINDINKLFNSDEYKTSKGNHEGINIDDFINIYSFGYERIEQGFKSEDKDISRASAEALRWLIAYTSDDDVRKKSLSLVDNNLQTILNLTDDINPSEEYYKHVLDNQLAIFDLIIRKGNSSEAENGLEASIKFFTKHVEKWETAWPSGSSLHRGLMAMFDQKLEGFGLNAKDFKNAWKVAHETEGLFYDYKNNLLRIIKLEQEQPGITKFLNKEYGIYNFFRYPKEILLDQYANRERDIAYGVIIKPRNDYNEAFYNNYLSSLKSQLGENFGLRIFECGSEKELGKDLVKLNRKFGAGHKISFLILGGHGSPDRIRFGEDTDEGSLDIEDLVEPKSNGARRFFVDKPTIILESCSTGADGGISENIFDVLGAKVVFAPKTASYISEIHVTKRNADLSFNINYEKKEHLRILDKNNAPAL